MFWDLFLIIGYIVVYMHVYDTMEHIDSSIGKENEYIVELHTSVSCFMYIMDA